MTGSAAADRNIWTRPLADLFARQRELTIFGLILVALTIMMTLAQYFDARTLGGANIWVKPARFAGSIGVFVLTTAWFFGYVRPERRQSALMRGTVWMVIVAGAFEIIWISYQASRALASHFNTDTGFYTFMYALMGLFAVILIAAAVPLAWEIGRRPAPGLRSDFVTAVVIGLVITFVLGTATGAHMAAQPSHAVGAEGNGLPLFGWNRLGGDLRIAHFMGIHAEQAMALLGAMVGGLSLGRARLLILGGAAAWSIIAVLLFAQAIGGRALWPM